MDEIKLLFAEIDDSFRLIAELLYGSGLRLSELLRLRVKDIDFDHRLIFVRGGKGDKDRTTVLPVTIRDRLATHLAAKNRVFTEDLKNGHGEVYLPEALARKYPNAASEWKWQWVFPADNLSIDPRSNRTFRHHVSARSVQRAIGQAFKRAKITKHASVHTLRHSFATHLLLAGTDIREIQELLGHKNVDTTMIYTHVLRGVRGYPTSPLDALGKSHYESEAV